jgi:hypothetical protein
VLMDLRYHAASLIAVFLALALGLIIGGSLASDQNLVLYQENLISRLEAENKALRNKQASDEASLLALRQEKTKMESNLNNLAAAYITQLSKEKRIKVDGSDALLGVPLASFEGQDYDYYFTFRDGGELSQKAIADGSATFVEVPKSIKLWELALYLVSTQSE